MTQINDCKLLFYQINGATSDDTQDAQREFLLLQGIPIGSQSGHVHRVLKGSRV